MELIGICLLLLVCFVRINILFGKVLPTEFQTSSSVFEGQWIRSSQPNVEIIPHDPIVERGANLTLRCVAHGIKHVHDYKWKVPFHMLMEQSKLAERDRKRTLEVTQINDDDHNKKFVCDVTNNFGNVWSQTITLRVLELMHPHSTQSVTLEEGLTVNNNRKVKSEGEQHSSGVGTSIGVGLVMGCIGICIGIALAISLKRRRQSCKVPNLDGAAKRRQPGRTITPDEHYMSLNQHFSANTSSTASSDRYQVDLGLPVYHQKPPLPPPRVVKTPVPPSRSKRHYKAAQKIHRREDMSKSKSMDSVYDTMKRSHQTIQEYVKPTELQYGSCEYIDMLANLRNPPLQQANNNNPRISLVDTYTTPIELFKDN